MDSTDKNLIQFGNYGILKTNVPNILYHNLPPNPKIPCKGSDKEVHINPKSLITNVHVNPNFKAQIRAMHINPKMRNKPLIHINPKMMRDIANSNQNLQNDARDTTETDNNSNTMQINIKRSIYVNPTLLKKLSSSKDESQKPKELITTGQPTCLSATPVKNINIRKAIPKKTGDSRVVLVSRRKLVRIPRAANNTIETSMSRYKLHVDLAQQKSNNIFQRSTKVPLLSNNASQSMCTRYNLPKLDIGKSKVNKYKIDRTALNVLKVKWPLKTKKIRNNNKVELVTIGGVVYKSSKTRLIRRSSLKRKRSISGNNDKPIVINNNRKLRNSRKTANRTGETNISSKSRLISSISPKVAYKNNISNKVKQRSIQILRNKMCKNNQPCLIFQRFGYCLNHKKGLCSKRHDAKQVSICKKFLQGKCLLDKCPLSHDVGPEKMPTCKYFLDGCCTRDACPYLHVKVSSNTSICIDFLQGYCAKGNECQRRHEYQCPEFDKSRNCSKGKYCPYPHKLHSFNTEENTKYLSKITHDVHKHQSISDTNDDLEITNSENRLRYYERTDNSSDVCDLERKKGNILKKIQIMKNVLNNDATVDPSKQAQINETTGSLVKENDESIIDITNNIKRRVPIGSLPAYIPIN